jgi:diguanylate cyclase (GGDEF)-like protein
MLVRARRVGTAVAALYVDIDGFKQVNDSLGHGDGDELLRVIASRLQGVMREADTVGRLAGDEFIVLLEDIGLDAAPELVAERICEVLSAPIELSRTLKITASIGIAVGPGDSADELIRNADIALYQAKAAGKNRWVAFEAEMQTAAQDRVELEMDLKDALAREEFFLLYQPIFELEQEKMVGVEALIRWRHPVRGIVPPNTFIGLAEQSGLISDIGEWVLMKACAEIAAWHARGNPLQISVNVSARQLEGDGLVATVAEALSRSGLEAEALTLEITETALMREPEAAVRRLHALKYLGVRIAIDDFGTGYSSLAYLRQFPVDELKIDRSFVAGLERSADAKALIHTLVHLGKALGLVTLGEGIEQEGQLRDLQRERCDTGQGFLLGRPMEPTALSEFVSSPDRRSAGDADADHEVVA